MTKALHRGFDNPPHAVDYVSGAEAAAILGVKRATLYAYASRGLVRSEPSGRGRARRYLRADLERLEARAGARAGHGAVAAGALRWGEPVLESRLTHIDAGELRYRGHRAVDLARTSSFEAVAELLWTGALPAERPSWNVPAIGLSLPSLAALVPAGAHPLVRLSVVVPALAAADLGAGRGDAAAERQRARTLIFRMAALLGAANDHERVERARASATVAAALLAGFGVPADARASRAVEQALVLLADHELNVSAFAVHVVASAGSDLYACVSAGLAAVSGPLHGGACDRVEAMVSEAGGSKGARPLLEARTRAGAATAGFGHPLYPGGDPRFRPLFEAAIELAPGCPALDTVRSLLDAGRDLGCGAPTVDIGLVSISLALGLPPGTAASIFALGRSAGWVAHALEQREAGFLMRPRARYVGVRGEAGDPHTPHRRSRLSP